MEFFFKFSNEIINAVLPPRCPKCKNVVRQNGDICHECWIKIDFIDEPMCHKCGVRMPYKSYDNDICISCQTNDGLYFDSIRSVCVYDGFVKSMIIELKESDRTINSIFLSSMLHKRFGSKEYLRRALITCVPSHKMTMIKRSFNHSNLIAKRFCRLSNFRYDPFVFSKIKPTAKQVGLNFEGRQKNLKDAFCINRNKMQKLLLEERLVIIDDVCTTGATINQLAIAAKKVNPNLKVDSITFARTLNK